MRIFLAGATGALGTQLLPLLLASGHEVTATTRSAAKAGALRDAGAEPVVLDALDRDAVVAAVVAARPDAIVHQLTSLTDLSNLRDFDAAFAQTNRLRTEATEYLLEGARAAGTRALRRPVLHELALRPHRRPGQDRGRPARPRAARQRSASRSPRSAGSRRS